MLQKFKLKDKKLGNQSNDFYFFAKKEKGVATDI